MSQHLIDSERRVSADRDESHEEAHRDSLHDMAAEERNRSALHGGYGGNGHGVETGEGRARDGTLRALDALSDALTEMSNDQRLLEKRLQDLHRQRSDGRAWRDILAEEDGPGTMQVVSRMLACLARASGMMRKELVDTLRREGVSIPAIAKLFGVTHQRVSNLLRRPGE